jgi:proteasome lid subunit RPN8/RPN11
MKIGKTLKQEPIDIKKFLDEVLNSSDDLKSKFSKFEKRDLLHTCSKENIPSFCTYVDVMAWDAFLDCANKAHKKFKHEACGLLMGKYFKDDYGEFIVGCQFEKGTGDSTSAVLCEISYEDNARIVEEYEGKNYLPVIWIHSHPGYGIFYSGQDNQTLREKYHERFHVGIVVDNLKKDYGGYKMYDGQIKEYNEVYLYHQDNDSILSFPPFGKDKIIENKKVELVEVNEKSQVISPMEPVLETENHQEVQEEENTLKNESELLKKKVMMNKKLLWFSSSLEVVIIGILIYMIFYLKTIFNV